MFARSITGSSLDIGTLTIVKLRGGLEPHSVVIRHSENGQMLRGLEYDDGRFGCGGERRSTHGGMVG